MEEVLVGQIRGELALIQPVISELLGLPSRWNGEVELTDESAIRGVKYYRCSIGIDRTLAEKPERWRTLIHELVHAHSVGVTPSFVERYPGWEEGPVEIYQRLVRAQVLATAGIEVEEAVFQETERNYQFRQYVADVELLRRKLAVAGEDSQTFYRGLLQTPLPNRIAWVLSEGRKRLGSAGFIPFFSPVNRRLCERLRGVV